MIWANEQTKIDEHVVVTYYQSNVVVMIQIRLEQIK